MRLTKLVFSINSESAFLEMCGDFIHTVTEFSSEQRIEVTHALFEDLQRQIRILNLFELTQRSSSL